MAVERNYTDWMKVINENKSISKPNDMKSEVGQALTAIAKMYGFGAANKAIVTCELAELGWKNFEG